LGWGCSLHHDLTSFNTVLELKVTVVERGKNFPNNADSFGVETLRSDKEITHFGSQKA
jgi:hypothetical protein